MFSRVSAKAENAGMVFGDAREVLRVNKSNAWA